jgi:hypothetical protein
MAIVLRKVRGLSDIEHNLSVLAQALSNISSEQIVSGAVGDNQTNSAYMPKTGGSFSGAISAPSISVAGEAVAINSSLSNYALQSWVTDNYYQITQLYTKTETDAAIAAATPSATTTVEGLVKQAAAVADLNQDISAAYVEAEVQAISDKVDALLAALRTSGALAT